ncbi:MAG TPA: winged helix-turn-helix domain-containing protein [Flavisolibacter sp.]|nr:winged helix-turn-helix domain-containing protein [Flavisolibacter sp.]
MQEDDFYIGSRYRVRPALNSISDNALGTEVRIEPRIMKLLCTLRSASGRLVSREYLIREIWDNYPGGEDGLTHSISALRKTLNDTAKELIETIPKKGYILRAPVQDESFRQLVKPRRKKIWRPVFIAFIVLIMGTGLYAFIFLRKENREGTEAITTGSKDLSVPFDAVNKQVAESKRNTISTMAADSTVYKLKIVGDGRPEFYINGRLLSPDEMEKHLDLINNLKAALQNRNSD